MERAKLCKDLDIPTDTNPHEFILSNEFDCDFLELEKEEIQSRKYLGTNDQIVGMKNKSEKKLSTEDQNRLQRLRTRKRLLRKKINKIKKSMPNVPLCTCNNDRCKGDYTCLLITKSPETLNRNLDEQNEKCELEERLFWNWISEQPIDTLTTSERIARQDMINSKVDGCILAEVDPDIFEN